MNKFKGMIILKDPQDPKIIDRSLLTKKNDWLQRTIASRNITDSTPTIRIVSRLAE